VPEPASAAPHPSDLRCELGHAVFAFVEPHRGHELAWNRWYERDHFAGLAGSAPWTLSTARWLATRREKAIAQPAERGSFLSAVWIQKGRYDDQQAWVAAQMPLHAKHGRLFDRRDVLTTAGWDLVAAVLRDADGVPPELALERRYPGIVLAWTERRPNVSIDAYRDWLAGEWLPGWLEKSPVAMALCFVPKPKPGWWPPAAPEVPGLGERILVACFTEQAPADCFDARFAPLGPALDAGGLGRTLFVAPFVPVVPGTDPPLDAIY
jgi:hypothetical protein